MTTSTRYRPYLWGQNSPTVRLVVVSEGFVSISDFEAEAYALCDLLDGNSPFNEQQFKPGGLSVLIYFVGGGAGPALGTAQPQSYFGFSLNTATGVLSPADSDRLADRVASTGAGNFDVCALLLPNQVAGNPISGTFARRYDLNQCFPRIVVATTADGLWPQIVLHAIGEFLGLGPENDGTKVASATDADTLRTQLIYPNVVFLPNLAGDPFVPDSTFKWWLELNGTQRKGLRVFPSGTPQSSAGDGSEIALFEGAAGYSKGMYRSAADCIMRWPYVSPAGTSLKNQEVVFCPICERSIRRLVGRSERLDRARTFHHQSVTFDQVTWLKDPTAYTGSAIPPQVEVQFIQNVSGEQWAFLAQFGAAQRGMVVKQLRFTGYPNVFAGVHPDTAPDVMDLIEFRDVAVKVGEGNAGVVADFDYNEAFTSSKVPPPVLQVAEGGSIPNSPTPVLHGLKLTLYSTCGGQAEVRLELSLVLKATAADFDPGGIVFGARYYPQIALTWKGNFGKTVHDMRGAVRMVFNNHEVDTPGGAGHMDHGDGAPPQPRTVANLFADTNNSPPTNASDRNLTLLPSEKSSDQGFAGSKWGVVFDYFKPDLQTETEFVGVYGPRSGAKHDTERKGTWGGPDGDPSRSYNITKYPRQGCYDNIHMHWNMGADPLNPSAVMVHAPGCGEACVHIHWRWGVLAGTGAMRIMALAVSLATQLPAPVVLKYLIPNPPEQFRGWNQTEPFAEVSLPLIPQNQELEVAITHPDTGRTAAFNRVLDGNSAPKALDPLRKAVWYTVSVADPPEGERQVVFEQGGDFAHTYHLEAGILLLTQLWYGKGTQLPLADLAALFHTDYSNRRWLKKSDGSFVPQIPQGTDTSKSTPVTSPEEM